ncbi:MAG: bifunctional folylpolyglutamate synthase/dihydrofolate synthase [Bacillus sp. (in: Bacteria)]|nr:bifunctional folylpolyglutamate synthase/dihydrofolate synthase [Bacillus sp. (in: firmicutes)]MCM1427082.1 bifunctional folylpolyglutamate synthase/dihydrofolate synthase [Eubacterium sp.]
MNYKEAMQYVESMQRYGSVYGLENMRTLCGYLDHPQDKLKFVHIAGTNGKGSVLAYISTVLWTAGYKVGRYISPTIADYRERFQINGKMIPQAAFCRYLEQVKEAVERMEEETSAHPTIFEIETALAFLYFLDKKCDIVVLETGLGGRMDATNIIKNPVCTVFSSISMDHMAVLGKSLEEIAMQKAGIIKDSCPVVTCSQKPEVMQILKKAALQHGCTFTAVDMDNAGHIRYGIKKQSFSYKTKENSIYKKLEITMAGQYQIENAVLAVEALETLKKSGFAVSEKQLQKGLIQTEWPGRFQVIGQKPLFIADGAHNEDAALKLAQSIRFYFTNKRILYIIGMLADKEYDKVLELTSYLAEHMITVTPPRNARAMSAYELAQAARAYHERVTVADSLQEAVELSYLLAGQDKDTVIIAFGSLSFLGELMDIVKHRDTIRRDSHGKSAEN